MQASALAAEAPAAVAPMAAAQVIDRVKIAHTLREYHHKALWEEEKHFTWLNSLVLSGQLLAFASKLSPSARGTLVSTLTALGLLSSLLALKVIRSEGRNFHVALQRYVRHHNAVFADFDDQLPLPTSPANKSFLELFLSSAAGRQNIRDSFQIVFIVFAALFVAMEVAVVRLNNLEWRPWQMF